MIILCDQIQKKPNVILSSNLIETPIGSMLAIGDNEYLYLLEFQDRSNLKFQIGHLCKETHSSITSGWTTPLQSIKEELQHYFNKKNFIFRTPIKMIGTLFQRKVWQELQKIPLHGTSSYLDIAKKIDRPSACRAVAQANSKNHLAIVIPCHRVIYQNGSIGGYAGGVFRKQWLLDHEKKMIERLSNI